jgi:hypothetical protein
VRGPAVPERTAHPLSTPLVFPADIRKKVTWQLISPCHVVVVVAVLVGWLVGYAFVHTRLEPIFENICFTDAIPQPVAGTPVRVSRTAPYSIVESISYGPPEKYKFS